MKIEQKNIFGKNKINFFTKERTQGFLTGILITIITGVISGIIIEYFKTLFLCQK